MFAVLEHLQPTGTPAITGARSTFPAVHWDLLVEVPGQERLATWQLQENPAVTKTPIVAQRIADHRRIYLEYEGLLSNERGSVRRIDHGEAQIRPGPAEGEAVLELHGRRLNGVFEVRTSGSTLTFRRLGYAAPRTENG